MQEAVCVLLDRFNSVYMQSISSGLLSLFKCVAWLVFELLAHFLTETGDCAAYCPAMYFPRVRPFLHPFTIYIPTTSSKKLLLPEERQDIQAHWQV